MKCTKMLTWCTGAVIVASFLFTSSECKTVSSSLRADPSSSRVASETSPGNVLLSVAKSLAARALSDYQETARRDPRFGLNFTLPMIMMPNGTTTTPGATYTNFLGTSAQLGLVGVKGGILGLKAALIQAGVLVLFIVFLLTGIAYFACNIGIISCSNLGGGLGNLGQLGGGGANPFSRNGYDYHHNHNFHRAASSVYNALDDGQKKYT